MALTLRIENETRLPDGGPVSITVSGRRSIDIGRDSHLDWTLPDPMRHISSKHCEVRYREGGYWLHDVSTNGTFLNGSDHRMQAPHRLRSGDRFIIGHYIIGASVDGEEAVAPPGGAVAAPAAPVAPNYQELWANDGSVAPPIDRAALKPPKDNRAVKPDFLDWAADVPDVQSGAAPFDDPAPSQPPPARSNPFEEAAPFRASAPAAPARSGDPNMDWASGPRTPQPPPPAAPPPVPNPRRPVWIAAEPGGPWGGEQAAPTPARAPDPPAAAAPAEQRGDAPTRPMPAYAEQSAQSNAIADRVAQGARVPADFFAHRDPAELAELMGQVMRLVVEGTMQLLNARLQAKRLARSSSHTMIEALDNNPLKFSPSAEDALRIMFGPATRSYLDAYSAFAQSFDDLKSHQVKTYGAMQHALLALMNEFDPEAIARETGEERGLAALVASRKARLWDAYVARWQAKSGRESRGLIDAFMLDFAKFYDREDER